MTSLPSAMRALRAHHPKGLSTVTLSPVPLPTIKSHELLIRIAGAGVLWPEITWDALYFDLQTHAPRDFTLGLDYSGTIVAVGDDVVDFKIGDEVYGLTQDWTESGSNKSGALAEYTRAPQGDVWRVPKGLGMVAAGGVPLSALTAYQALFKHAGLGDGKGKRVLVTGGAGGTGVFAVQMAKNAGAHVTTTASSAKSLALLRDLGADEILNYKTSPLDPAQHGLFDVILDTVGGDTLESCWRMLAPAGWITSLTINPWASAPYQKRADDMGVRSSWFIVQGSGEDLGVVSGMIEDGKLRVVVDRVFGFEEAVEAYRVAMEGHVCGKIVVEIGR